MNSDLRTQEEQEPPVEEREQRSSLHKSHRVIDITGMLKGHRDTELSSLLADFLEAGFGELKSRDPGLSAPAAIPQHDRDPSLVHAVSELTIDPRLWDALQQPHFSSIDLPPPRRSRFWILGYLHRRTHPHHPTVYQYIATVRKAPMAFDFNKYVDPILSQAPRSPQLGYAWAHAGLQLIDAGKLTSARTAFEQAGKCLPQNSAVRNNHAAVLMAEGKFDAAYELLMEGFKHNPANRYVEYNIALILLQRKQYEKAIDWFAEAGRSDIHSVPAAFLKAYCLYHIGRYREALSIFEALPHNIPYAHQAHFNQGLTLLKLGEYGKAVEVFTSCLNEMPTDADAMAARGWAWWQCSNVEEALKDYTSAIELKPANLSYRTARGFITYKQGKYDLAIEDIETMTRLVPENRQFQLLLQEIRQELSQPSLFRMNGSEGGPV
jgi:tetratricopeptide (TPR) repeat protein